MHGRGGGGSFGLVSACGWPVHLMVDVMVHYRLWCGYVMKYATPICILS
jgi:hypothetical protein